MGRLVCSLLGWTYVLIRFRNLKKARFFVDENYNGSYSATGSDLLLSSIAMFGAIFMIVVVIVGICIFLYRIFTGTLSPT